MKYLKTFETVELSQLKEYVVWDLELKLVILRVIEIYEECVSFERLYMYNKYYEKLVELNNDNFLFDVDKVKSHILYTSNDLNDCLNKELLRTLQNINKFNL